MKKKMALCTKCALKLKENAEVRQVTREKDRKVNCRLCGRTRFGADYEVGGKQAGT